MIGFVQFCCLLFFKNCFLGKLELICFTVQNSCGLYGTDKVEPSWTDIINFK